ncbi:MAG: F0F1 ATP synthase subunit A [Flavobacteriales bacterium]|nr:F0F1 ATP synthase subunit A [Bacteroidota bacterium]MCB9240259.1 F0F1 ATP synthase subunit A [Flavobacteriales bacterium]
MQTSENKKLTNTQKGMKNCLFALLGLFLSLSVAANPHSDTASSGHDDQVHSEEAHNESHEEGFDAGQMIMHHIADAHEIHFLTWNAGTENESDLSIHLPVILWTNDGLKMFSSGHLYHNPVHADHGHAYQHENFIMYDEVIYYANEHGHLEFDEYGAVLNDAPLDLSITKTVVGLLLTSILILLIFLSVAKTYKRNPKEAPKGLQAWMEPLILFVRDDVVRPSVGEKKADKFMPFLLTVFFFIWIANLLGLMSFIGGYNVMGSMAVTMVLAILVFIITTYHGNKHYWMHIVWPSGVPFLIKLILVPIEVVQIFLKPIVLMIRLTANITAGHIIILAFTALIFIFGQSSAAAGYGVGAGSLIFMIFMFLIELLVAFLQAYVFTLLSAIYFGSAVEEAHH